MFEATLILINFAKVNEELDVSVILCSKTEIKGM